MARFVMAGGGTGGHVLPLIAVAVELRRRGHESLFVGTREGMEARLAPEAGFRIEWIEIGGVKRVGVRKAAAAAWKLPASVARCARLLRQFRPAAVFSLGGYVAGPMLAAAAMACVPVVAMEPNAAPGLTTKLSARFVDRALVSWPETVSCFPRGRAEVTGTPIHAGFFSLPDPPRGEFTVLITGGSRGSRTLNRAFRESWPLFHGREVRFVHQCGRDAFDELARGFRESGLRGEVTAFIADMPAAFARAHLVVGRSGASAVAELAAAGKPSILVPFPFAADGHQRKNAESLAAVGAARVILDEEMSGRRLFDEVTAIAGDPAALARMGAAAKSQARPGAAARAADILEGIARRSGGQG